MDVVNKSSEAYFRSIPWCTDLLNDASFTITGLKSRQPKPTNEDACFAETFNSPATIPHCVAQYRTPSSPGSMIEEVRMLCSVGGKLDGNPNTLHGGIQSFILDEVMAKISSFNKDRQVGGVRRETVTAELQVKFRKAVRTPAVLVAAAKVDRVVGRRIYVSSSLRDGAGQVLTTAEAVFVTVEPSRGQRL